MKLASAQLAYLMGTPEARSNLGALLRYAVTMVALITVYAVIFHVIKIRVEGEQHSWIAGSYWTLSASPRSAWATARVSDSAIRTDSVMVVTGTESQIAALNELTPGALDIAALRRAHAGR
jgi:hypothetical protein